VLRHCAPGGGRSGLCASGSGAGCALAARCRHAPCHSPAAASSLLPQKTRPDALAFLSDFVVDAVVDQFAREIVLEITRERSREALYELKAQREWDALLSSEIGSVAVAALEECRAELVAAAKKAQPQVRPSACCPRYRIASQMLRLLREWFCAVRLHACRVQCAADDICRAHRFACSGPSGQQGGG